MKRLKERVATATSSVSGITSILGSWQICHNVCLAFLAMLGAIGIVLTGMPLMFLTKVAIPFWIIAVVFLGFAYYMYRTKSCISRNLLIINTGLIIAGTPFTIFQPFQAVFWTIGGAIVLTGIALFIKEKKERGVNMKKIKEYAIYGLLGVVIVGLVVVLITSFVGRESDLNIPTTSVQNSGQIQDDTSQHATISSGSTDPGSVSIDLTPKEFQQGRMVFELAVNTHSVDLSSFDLKEITTLEADGKTYSPISTPVMSGHHVTGQMNFDLPHEPTTFTVTIKGVPLEEKRVFKWN